MTAKDLLDRIETRAVDVDSSVIERAVFLDNDFYEPDGLLGVRISNTWYFYVRRRDLYDSMLEADSIGRFFNSYLRGEGHRLDLTEVAMQDEV